MKRLFLFLFVIAAFAACEGDQGPEGPQGAPGQDGQDGIDGEDGLEAFVFEYENVDFTSPDYSVTLPYPNFTALASDVTLVFLLWDVVDIDGVEEEVWRALPQSLITENGLLQYNYDFTRVDTQIFIASEFDKGLLEPIDTDDWIVRIVVVPGKFFDPNGKMESVDLADYQNVIETLGLSDIPVPDNYNPIQRRN